MDDQSTWRNCSSCKKPIALKSRYYMCSVSSCNAASTNYVFCSVACFERHLPVARHRDAGAIEKIAPAQREQQAATQPKAPASTSPEPRAPSRFVVSKPGGPAVSAPSSSPREVLVIASRLKDYIQARSEYNTSQSVMDVLSDHLRILCERAIDNARADGRKTVMDRDFEFLKK